jgi:hypothetical protein
MFIHEYIVFPLYSPPIPIPHISPILLVATCRQALFYLSVLLFLKKDRFCLFKITIQGVSLQRFHAYMYCNFNWFIPSTHIELILKQGERLDSAVSAGRYPRFSATFVEKAVFSPLNVWVTLTKIRWA